MLNSLAITKLMNFYPVLKELPPRLQHDFVNTCIPILADPGKILFDPDDTIQSFLFLTEGSIRVTQRISDRELFLYRILPGECCIVSLCHLFGDTRLRVRAQVETTASGVALPQNFFLQMAQQSPPFSEFLFHSFAGRFADLFELVEAITVQRLDARLAGLLLSRGKVIKTTHSQLADELGTVREVISRILKDLEARGLVELERGQIRVVNEEALRELAGFRDSGH